MTTLTNHEPHYQFRHWQSELIPKGANCLQLELTDGHKFDLTQVRINRSFVFGLLEDNLTWCLVRLNHVLALRFQIQASEVSPVVTWTRKTASELLASLALPAEATFWFQNEPRKKVGLVVLGATRGLVVTNSHVLSFVPLQVISHLEISQTNLTERNTSSENPQTQTGIEEPVFNCSLCCCGGLLSSWRLALY